MQKLLIPVLIFLTIIYTLTSPQTIHADAIGMHQREIEVENIFQGWENVKEYVLIYPQDYITDWYTCYDSIKVRMVTNNKSHFFGYEGHSAGYSPMAAVPKKFQDDITYLRSEVNGIDPHEVYSLKCNSQAYQSLIPANVEIPHTDIIVNKSDPLQKVEYIIQIKGIDSQNNILLLSVDKRINYYNDGTTKIIPSPSFPSYWEPDEVLNRKPFSTADDLTPAFQDNPPSPAPTATTAPQADNLPAQNSLGIV